MENNFFTLGPHIWSKVAKKGQQNVSNYLELFKGQFGQEVIFFKLWIWF